MKQPSKSKTKVTPKVKALPPKVSTAKTASVEEIFKKTADSFNKGLDWIDPQTWVEQVMPEFKKDGVLKNRYVNNMPANEYVNKLVSAGIVNLGLNKLNKITGSQVDDTYDKFQTGKSVVRGRPSEALTQAVGSMIPNLTGGLLDSLIAPWSNEIDNSIKNKTENMMQSMTKAVEERNKSIAETKKSKNTTDMKTKKTTPKRTLANYAMGSGNTGVIKGYYPNPDEVFAQNNINIAKAQYEAASNPWTTAGKAVGKAGMAYGMNMFQNAGGINGLVDAYKTDTMFQADMGTGPNGMDKTMVEAEQGEVMETPDGEVSEVGGQKHANGGTPMVVEEGTKFFSDQLKVAGKTMAERKASRERSLDKLLKAVERDKSDVLSKNTYKQMSEKYAVEEEQDLQLQEFAGKLDNAYDYAMGTGRYGVKKMALGGYADTEGDPPLKFPRDIFASADYNTNSLQHLQDEIGIDPSTPGYGTAWGKKSDAAYLKWLKTNYPADYKGIMKGGQTTFFDNYVSTADTLARGKAVNNAFYDKNKGKSFKEKMGLTEQGYKYDPQQPDMTVVQDEAPVEQPILPDWYKEGMFDPKSEEYLYSAPDKPLAKSANANLSLGDMIGMGSSIVGQYKANMNTLANRANTKVNVNENRDFGIDALAANEQATDFLRGQQEKALGDINLDARSAITNNRNSARGVNQNRAMDAGVFVNANKAKANIYDNFSKQMLAQLNAKSNLENIQDDRVMTGALTAANLNAEDMDNFYSNRSQDIQNTANVGMNLGKSLNTQKGNQDFLDMLPDLSAYGLGYTRNANGKLEIQKVK